MPTERTRPTLENAKAPDGGITESVDESTDPPLDLLVPLHERRLHLLARGHGDVTVLVDGANGEGTAGWQRVAEELQHLARVVRYDRAGFGSSELPPTPLTADDSAQDLRLALKRAQLDGPYLPIGHGFGASVMRSFAHRYRSKVIGLILADPRPPGFAAAAPREWRKQQARQMALLARRSLLPRLSPWTKSSNSLALLRESAAYAESDREVAALPRLGNMPLIVIGHDRPDLFERLPECCLLEAEGLWQQLLGEIAASSDSGRLWVAEGAGHDIPSERPDLIVRAVKEILALHGGKAAAGDVGKNGLPTDM